jgi:hypothetical protein
VPGSAFQCRRPRLRISRIALQARHGRADSGFQIRRRPWRRIWRIALQARPRSADRTRSPAAISQKREFFKCPPETIGYFAPRMPKFGARRLMANSQKPAIGGPFYEYHGQFLRAPDCLAGAGGFEPPDGDWKSGALACPREATEPLSACPRAAPNLPNQSNVMLPVHPYPQKHSPSNLTQIICLSPAVSPQQGGVS